MKAAVLEKASNYDIPLAYLKGSRHLFSQDFVIVQNLLLDNEDFQSTLTGVLFTVPKNNLRLRAPGIEMTSEFYRDPIINNLIPLWYRYKVKLPVQSTSINTRTLSLQTVPGQTLVEIKNLKDSATQHIVINQLKFLIDGQEQSSSSYTINHADGSLLADLSALAPNVYNLEVQYTIVQLSIDISVLEGVTSLRVRKHYKEEFLVDVLTSRDTNITAKYQYRGKSFEELGLPDILYTEVEPELVALNTYTFSYVDVIKFPTKKTYLLFAIRSKRSYLPTIFGPREPQGLDSERPWHIRLEGILPLSYKIKEVEISGQRVEGKKQRATIISKNQIKIGANRLFLTSAKDNKHIEGISVYSSSNTKSLLPVNSYDSRTGVITLDVEVPFAAEIYVEFRELVDWVDYENLQLNPILENDPESILSQKFLVYVDFNSTDDDRNIFHIGIPKIVNGEFYNYSLQELRSIVSSLTVNGLALALVEVTETTDEDYYIDYDLRTRGGYSGESYYLTDRATWDGENVDITGQLFTFVPRKVVEDQKQLELKWDVGLSPESAELIARNKIEAVIVNTTRVGMNNEILYEGEF
jgi:hypothetical protein